MAWWWPFGSKKKKEKIWPPSLEYLEEFIEYRRRKELPATMVIFLVFGFLPKKPDNSLVYSLWSGFGQLALLRCFSFKEMDIYYYDLLKNVAHEKKIISECAVWKGELGPHSEIKEMLIEKRVEEDMVFFDDVKAWLAEKGENTGFFFTSLEELKGMRPLPDYMNPDHPCYSWSLASAVRAWEHVSEAPLNGTSPKKAIEEWLENNISEISANAKGDIARVANWDKDGGAPTTPAKNKKMGSK